LNKKLIIIEFDQHFSYSIQSFLSSTFETIFIS